MNKRLRNLIFAAMFLAIALVLPFLTGQIPQFGNMFCPMHLPVMLCGFVCGPIYGLIIGILAPLLRSLLFSMPPMWPTAFAMCFELGVYGLACGLFYRLLPKKGGFIYLTLVLAMILGRLVWGAVMFIISASGTGKFGLAMFWTNGFVNAIPGIIIQFVVIPYIVVAMQRAKLIDNSMF